MIIDLYGQPESGKTTLSHRIKRIFPQETIIIIDGDELREATENKNYTVYGRKKNIKTAHRLANLLEKQGYTIILALVSPYKTLREKLKKQTREYYSFYLYSSREKKKKNNAKNFEIGNANKIICTDDKIESCLAEILQQLKDERPKS